MLNDDVKNAIQGAYRNWLNARGLRPRSGQRAMIAQVANALARSNDPDNGASPICVVEAGTGTGKTIAYAVAAIPIAQALGKKLVISTATVALQEQLFHRDLPDLKTAGALDFSYALAKGRGRYVCPARLDSLLRGARDEDGAQLALVEQIVPGVNQETRELLRELYTAVTDGSWAGDRDSWPAALPDSRWALMTTDHHQCSGRRCSYVSQCPFFTAREGLDGVDCIVANHDLVLADLALGGGAVLPAPEDAIYVFDEAHHLPDKACNHLSFRARLGLAREHAEDCRRLATELMAEPRSSDALRRRLAEVPALCEELDHGLSAAGRLLGALLAGAGRKGDTAVEYRLPHGVVPPDVAAIAAHAAPCAAQARRRAGRRRGRAVAPARYGRRGGAGSLRGDGALDRARAAAGGAVEILGRARSRRRGAAGALDPRQRAAVERGSRGLRRAGAGRERAARQHLDACGGRRADLGHADGARQVRPHRAARGAARRLRVRDGAQSLRLPRPCLPRGAAARRRPGRSGGAHARGR